MIRIPPSHIHPCDHPESTYVFDIVGSLRHRGVTYSTSNHQGSNFESCGWRADHQERSIRPCYHLIHLTRLRMFSRPSSAYMCTKVPQNPIHFISFFLTNVLCANWNNNYKSMIIEIRYLSTSISLYMKLLLQNVKLCNFIAFGRGSFRFLFECNLIQCALLFFTFQLKTCKISLLKIE